MNDIQFIILIVVLFSGFTSLYITLKSLQFYIKEDMRIKAFSSDRLYNLLVKLFDREEDDY